jgi:DNA repair ATPase RecN
MLEKLVIKNIALITPLEVTLSGGMNVLPGETGAGKSSLVASVPPAASARPEMIRTGGNGRRGSMVFRRIAYDLLASTD